jgi:hypothetical protein
LITLVPFRYRLRMRRGVAILVLVGISAIAVGVYVVGRGEPAAPAEPATAHTERRAPAAHDVSADPAPRRPDVPLPQPPADARSGEIAPGLDAGGTWDAVDMDAVRDAMPDNLYWKVAVPCEDPRVLEERDAERARWNVEYGKILSGTGTEEEIRAYYDHRARLSGDYVEFTSYLLDHYGTQLPERDVGLLQLARRLHLARLEEIPRKVEEALERKRAQDAAREAWLADQRDFGSAAPDGDAE